MEEFELLSNNIPSIGLVLSGIFYFAVGFFAIFTGILYYHWTSYATDKTVSRITLILYFVCTVPLILIMGGVLLVT